MEGWKLGKRVPVNARQVGGKIGKWCAQWLVSGPTNRGLDRYIAPGHVHVLEPHSTYLLGTPPSKTTTAQDVQRRLMLEGIALQLFSLFDQKR